MNSLHKVKMQLHGYLYWYSLQIIQRAVQFVRGVECHAENEGLGNWRLQIVLQTTIIVELNAPIAFPHDPLATCFYRPSACEMARGEMARGGLT